jgi:hypothetical protein
LLNILYPTPTTTGCGTNTFEEVQELSQSTRFSLRLDHKISDKDQIRFTWLRAFYGPNATNGSDSLQGGNSGRTASTTPTPFWAGRTPSRRPC